MIVYYIFEFIRPGHLLYWDFISVQHFLYHKFFNFFIDFLAKLGHSKTNEHLKKSWDFWPQGHQGQGHPGHQGHLGHQGHFFCWDLFLQNIHQRHSRHVYLRQILCILPRGSAPGPPVARVGIPGHFRQQEASICRSDQGPLWPLVFWAKTLVYH